MAPRWRRQTRDAKEGSWTRSIALVAIALTGIGALKLIHGPQVSPQGVQAYMHSDLDLAMPNEVLPPTPISQINLEFIKHLEGFHATPYFDGTQRSWGYGTKAGRGSITREQAEQEMKAYLQQHCLPILPRGLPVHKATALASFCYNLGPDQAQQTDLWRAAHRGGRVNFLGYTRSARGVSLLSRRRQEQTLWEIATVE
jgi:GH24 family phage-related lysozyme (muramidase)